MSLSVFVTGDPPVLVEMVEMALGVPRPEFDAKWAVHSTPAPGENPDVVVLVALHPSLPAEADGIRTEHPNVPLVWLAGQPNGAQVTRALRRGCSSVISARSKLSELVTGVASAAAGETFSTPDLLASVVRHIHQPIDESAELSERESEVLGLLSSGLSTQEIADLLSISIHTARNHVRRILQKMNAHSRIEALQRARARGLVLDRDDGQ